MQVFVTGGTGLVGRHLVPALLERGDGVVCLTRHQTRARSLLPVGVEFIEADPTAQGDWQEQLTGCDAVVNLAGESLASGRWTSAKKQRIRHSRLRTTDHLVEAIQRLDQPCTFVSSSATGYYGDGGGQALAETDQPGHDFLARLAYEWELKALRAESDLCRVVLLRFGVVLARDGGALPKLALPFRFGLGGAIGNGRQYFPWIHIADLIRIILLVIDDDQLSGPINAVVPVPPTQGRFAKVLGKTLRRPSFLGLPAFVLNSFLGEKAGLLLASQRVVPNVLKARGFRFEYDDLDHALFQLLC